MSRSEFKQINDTTARAAAQDCWSSIDLKIPVRVADGTIQPGASFHCQGRELKFKNTWNYGDHSLQMIEVGVTLHSTTIMEEGKSPQQQNQTQQQQLHAEPVRFKIIKGTEAINEFSEPMHTMSVRVCGTSILMNLAGDYTAGAGPKDVLSGLDLGLAEDVRPLENGDKDVKNVRQVMGYRTSFADQWRISKALENMPDDPPTHIVTKSGVDISFSGGPPTHIVTKSGVDISFSGGINLNSNINNVDMVEPPADVVEAIAICRHAGAMNSREPQVIDINIFPRTCTGQVDSIEEFCALVAPMFGLNMMHKETLMALLSTCGLAFVAGLLLWSDSGNTVSIPDHFLRASRSDISSAVVFLNEFIGEDAPFEKPIPRRFE